MLVGMRGKLKFWPVYFNYMALYHRYFFFFNNNKNNFEFISIFSMKYFMHIQKMDSKCWIKDTQEYNTWKMQPYINMYIKNTNRFQLIVLGLTKYTYLTRPQNWQLLPTHIFYNSYLNKQQLLSPCT